MRFGRGWQLGQNGQMYVFSSSSLKCVLRLYFHTFYSIEYLNEGWQLIKQKAPQPTPSQPYPPPAPEGSLKIASILLLTAGPSINTSDILWLKSQVLLSSGEYKKCHELLVQHGQGGSLARDWYRMKGIEEISKRVQGDQDWVWEKELGEFLDYWLKDDLAYVLYPGTNLALILEVSELCVLPALVLSIQNPSRDPT